MPKPFMTVHEMRQGYLHYFTLREACDEKVMSFDEYCKDFEEFSGMKIKGRVEGEVDGDSERTS